MRRSGPKRFATSQEPKRQRERVIVVDDDALFLESLGQNLVDAGFEVSAFESGEPALAYILGGGDAEVILLDWRMPGMNGIEVLRRLRQSDVQIPVIFLTALSDQIYEEAALQGGAVDFVEKSRSFAILLKRIDLILAGARASRPNEIPGSLPSVVEDGGLTLDLDIRRAFWQGEQIDLSLTEFNILCYLVSRADQDIAYRDLYNLVWGKDFLVGQGEKGYRTNVRGFIKRIRQKFRDVDEGFARIRNYPGFGYRWLSERADDA